METRATNEQGEDESIFVLFAAGGCELCLQLVNLIWLAIGYPQQVHFPFRTWYLTFFTNKLVILLMISKRLRQRPVLHTELTTTKNVFFT